jgi:uncharacterized oxidoreductase
MALAVNVKARHVCALFPTDPSSTPMPIIQHDALTAVISQIVSAAGSRDDEPDLVASNLVYANLTGHDSHGVGMIPRYIAAVHTGELRPNQHASIEVDDGPMLTIDGNAGYGQVIGREAMELGIDRAREHGVCVMAIRNSFHLCRIGAWGQQCARAGMVSMHHVNVRGHAGIVAPFRGSDARYSTNPYCATLPATGNNEPVVLDFATSIVAHGKVRVARNKGETMADDILIDAHGKATNDPNALFEGGALRPFGTHKGYGMALVNELLAGSMTGGGACRPENDREHDTILNNMLSIIIDPGRLVDRAWFENEVDATLAHVRASPPEHSGEPVLIPGEPERIIQAQRSSEGIPVDERTWEDILGAGRSVNLSREMLERTAGL